MSPDIDKQTQEQIQQLQMLEQNFQQLLMQKQAFQLELNETKTASEEVTKAKSDVFRVLGQVMVKADKKTLKKELSEKQDLLTLRMTSIEKQETELRAGIERIRSEVMNKIQ